ncbi:hypothetical protein PHMEG_00013122 [Phytophthora megakarya]|uniref:Uncharacterized protein n=1 Tax=Phytophthora megakarya TaxID=4795 RepID=A0A225W8P6_9STRA|nr:hypothetical protein PHMEG_00013122 [Phytophthora megakarya]
MSVEAWADVISNLCDTTQVVNPQMRYQYFLAGHRTRDVVYHCCLFAGEVTKKPNSEESMMQQMLG